MEICTISFENFEINDNSTNEHDCKVQSPIQEKIMQPMNLYHLEVPEQILIVQILIVQSELQLRKQWFIGKV